ncbi:hypothetical protein Tco_0780690 [Tanacetum coccineum]
MWQRPDLKMLMICLVRGQVDHQRASGFYSRFWRLLCEMVNVLIEGSRAHRDYNDESGVAKEKLKRLDRGRRVMLISIDVDLVFQVGDRVFLKVFAIQRRLDLEKKKDAQAVEILRLRKRVKILERQRTSSTSQPRRRKYKQVESSDDDLNEEDASKQERSSDKTEPMLCNC